MLHNLGHEHPSISPSGRNIENVAGTFVYEAGWCVARRGGNKTPGTFGLTGEANTPWNGFYVD
jgi:hypothetical protein